MESNNREKAFRVETATRSFEFPYAKTLPKPTAMDPVVATSIDKELGRYAFTYVLRSGREGSIHIEQVLDYNKDPRYLRDALLYRLTIEAQKRRNLKSIVQARDHPPIRNVPDAILPADRSDELQEVD